MQPLQDNIYFAFDGVEFLIIVSKAAQACLWPMVTFYKQIYLTNSLPQTDKDVMLYIHFALFFS